jgi:AMP phosphorylase
MRNEKLNYEEIREIVKDISEERLSEIEATAFVSAVFMRGLDMDETISMAKALIADGNRIDFEKGIIVDKHSVGGVNGRATMIVVPIIASSGLLIPKTSSRSITSSAGTADSMEVLADVSLPMESIKKITEKNGGVIAWGGAVDLAPADDKIIKIEHPLSLDPEGQVIASVLAKKASVGSKYVVIDLPVGKYVKIKDKAQAMRMAKKFVQVGREVGMHVEAVITNGEGPCGLAFGPALEAKYALEILEGKRFDNLAQKSCELAGALLEMVGKAKSGLGYSMALEVLQSGNALKKMKEIIKAQGGKIFSSEDVPEAPFKKEFKSGTSGTIEELNTKELTKIARLAGAPGNRTAGIMLNKLAGDKVIEGETLMVIYAENREKLALAESHAMKNIPFRFKKIILKTIK